MVWLTIRDCVVAGASLVMFLLAVGALFGGELRKLSRRGIVVFVLGAGIATGVAQKRTAPDGGGSLRHVPSLDFLLSGSSPVQPERSQTYTNPVRFVSFAHSPTAVTASVTWDWPWSPDAYYHFVNFYGTYALPSNRWVDAGRVRISDWGVATNLSAVLQWPSVFSNAVSSGTFPTNATLAAAFLSVFPELDTDGDGLPDGDEVRLYGTRWDLCDSDGDGIDDPDELFDVGTDPTNPDSDDDGMPDGWEWYCDLDPNDPSDVLGDYDQDGLGNLEEALLGTRPNCSDTDGDHLSDYDEVRLYGTDPCLADTDGDGMDDHEEILRGFDPCFAGEYHGPVRPDGYNPNAYYTVGITADEPMTWVAFDGDGESDLVDPSFFIRSNETVDVTLLMGKTYRILSSNSVVFVRTDTDGVSVLTNATGGLTIVRPVTVALLPEYNLMSFGAGSLGGDGSFRMGVTPDVGGVFDWTNSCCAITSRGNQFWFACDGHCGCGGCFASGCLRYEGYALPCVGGFCGCPHGDDDFPTEEDDQPHAEGISVSFSAPAVIFEDEYDNTPTSSVPRRSTRTTLSCVAHGGLSGGFADFSIANADKITAVEGTLPSRTFVPPMQKLEFTITYEGTEKSDSVDDIVATGIFAPCDGRTALTDSASLTSVRVELKVINLAFENTRLNRHDYGINEPFILEVSPCPSEMEIEITDARMTSSLSAYNVIRWGIAEENHYLCLLLCEVAYEPMISVLTPSGIEGYDEEARSLAVPAGSCGGVELCQKYRILPKTVSFNGLLVEEVPCDDEIPPTGYFQYFPTNRLSATHNMSAGAGRWHCVNEDNSTDGDDSAAFVGVLQRIKPNGEFTDDVQFGWMGGERIWKVPFGWTSNSLGSAISPVGVFAEDTRQTFSIFANGDLSISKLGHKAYRKITGEVYKNGAEAE